MAGRGSGAGHRYPAATQVMMNITGRSRVGGQIERSQSAVRFVAPVLVTLTLMLAAAVTSVELLSAIRAWVGGEGLYSKGQKNATYTLARYTHTHSADEFKEYQAAIAIASDLRTMRIALQQDPVDVPAARAALIDAGNSPDDIDSMIRLFRWFGNVGPIRDGIAIWTEGDVYTERIATLGTRARRLVEAGAPDGDTAQIRTELQQLNLQLTTLEDRFSATLGEAARETRTALIVALTGITFLTGLLCIRVTRARLDERDAKERGLARLTELYAALNKTSQLILRVSERDELFTELCRICASSSGLKAAAVGLVAGDGSSVDFVATHGADGRLLQALTRPDPAQTNQFESVHRALREGRFQVCNEVPLAGGPESKAASAQSVDFRSTASFPLRCQGGVIGVLSVFSDEESFFRQDFVDLMEQLAMGVSFALEVLQREAERRFQATLLADQNRILNLVASGADLPVIFATLAQFMENQADGALCSLLALDQGGSQYCLSVSPSMPDDFDRALLQASSELGAGPVTEAIRRCTTVAVDDLASYPVDASLRGFMEEAHVQTATVWPILGSESQGLGALALYFRGPSRPDQPRAHLIDICTDLAGIAIESRRTADRIRHVAHHDELTGLPNRLLFNHHLPRALALAERQGGSVAVLFLDLDRFKVVNDTLGHGAGDDVLCQVARHLRDCVRTTDTLARVGGDEFTLLVEQFKDPQDLAEIAQKLLAATAGTLMIDGQECHLSGSIGIAIYPKDGTDSASLLKNADIAMYRAKTSGRNNFKFYSSEINAHSVERFSLENQLRHAVARREFEVHYQPKIHTQTGAIVGAEALIRWRHPERGLLLPGEFIAVAEEAGLIGSIGGVVLETVCVDSKRWRDKGMPAIRIAINLSAQQFEDTRLLDDLDRVLRDTGCEPAWLEFEITETVVMTSPSKALLLLEQIKERGITLAIDDFGTGHSSLAYLKRFPVDRVKIDRTFIRDIAVDANDLAITKAIIALGHSMGLKVVAEGVETTAQLDILRRSRCDEYQGFLFSKALPAAEFESLVDSRTPERAAVRARPAG